MGGVVYAQSLELLHQLDLPDGGEIVAFSPSGATLAVTGERSVRLFGLDARGRGTPRATVGLGAVFDGPDQPRSVSSAALDPAGRGFGVAAVIPRANGTRRGAVVFFDVSTGEVLRRVEAGYHPDSVVFAPDGARLFVVNEGEFTVGGDVDAPGSLSMIDLSAVSDADDLGRARFAGDFPFTRWSLSPRVDLSVLRLNAPTTTHPYRHVEPEYAVVAGGRVYVSLQENNAVGVFDPQRRQWRRVWPMGTLKITIDASDKDGGARIAHDVEALPMPDTIAVYRAGGRRVLVTADEGDFRVDNGDRRRAGEFDGVAPDSGLDVDAVRDDARLGRLRLSVPDSDPDGDGLLDRLVVPGARGVSFWDADTGQLLGTTGSLEAWLAERDPARHNLDAKDAAAGPDQRSDDKGPEPEGLAVVTLSDGRVLVAVALERQNGLVLIDATDPRDPQPLSYRNDLDRGLVAPECVLWVRASDFAEGSTEASVPPSIRLLVGYEGDGDGVGCGVAVYRLVLP